MLNIKCRKQRIEESRYLWERNDLLSEFPRSIWMVTCGNRMLDLMGPQDS